MAETTPRRKHAADVVGFSKLMSESEDRTLKNLENVLDPDG